MERTNPEWLAQLAADDPSVADGAAADLGDFLRRTLARGFGRQLSDADLDDLTQDALMRVHAKRDGFSGASRFTTWAASIAVNEALQRLRKRRFAHLSWDETLDLGQAALARPTAPDRVQRAQAHTLLRDAIDEVLSPRQREAMLAELAGLPLMEIASRMETSRGALYKVMHDARKKLLAYFQARGLTLDALSAVEVQP